MYNFGGMYEQQREGKLFYQRLQTGGPKLFLCGLSVQFSSIQLLSHVRLCDPMNFNTPGIPVHHQFPERIQTHVHRVGDAIQPSHPLLSPSPPAFNLFPAIGSFQMSQSTVLCII